MTTKKGKESRLQAAGRRKATVAEIQRVGQRAQQLLNKKPSPPKTSAKAGRKPMPLPRSLPACVDAFYALRDEKSEASKVVKAIELDQGRIREHLVNNISKSRDKDGVAGKVALAKVSTELYPQLEDWDRLIAHVKKTGNFDLLPKQINSGLLKEMLVDPRTGKARTGKTVPGVKLVQIVKLSVTQL
jgi:hypothetical protein